MQMVLNLRLQFDLYRAVEILSITGKADSSAFSGGKDGFLPDFLRQAGSKG